MMIQTIITYIIIAVALILTIRGIYKVVSRRGGGGECGRYGCEGCKHKKSCH